MTLGGERFVLGGCPFHNLLYVLMSLTYCETDKPFSFRAMKIYNVIMLISQCGWRMLIAQPSKLSRLFLIDVCTLHRIYGP